MDKELVRQMLPETPPGWYESWIQEAAGSELELRYVLFSAERECQSPGGKKIWQTRCTCTQCGEDFVTRHIKQQGGVKGFAMYMGEDGCMYSLDPVEGKEPVTDGDIEDWGYDANVLEIGELDDVICPCCCATGTALHRSELKGGRTKQVQGCTVQNVGIYTAVIYWLTALRVFEDGSYDFYTYPRDAYVIGERGGLTQYRHTIGSAAGYQSESKLTDWQLCGHFKDCSLTPYHDWGSINNRKVDGAVCRRLPFLGGVTGEKTGIEAYIEGGGQYPVTYLKMWYKHRRIENLAKAGWVQMIEENITRYASYYGYGSLSSEISGVDFAKRKPHEMLGMSKSEFREISKNPWGRGAVELWSEYRYLGGRCSAMEFDGYFREFGQSGVAAMLSFREQEDQVDFPELLRYLKKQGLGPGDLHLLVDAREMAEEMYPDRALTEAELWPRNLRQVHDQLARLQAIQKSEKESAALQEGFSKILDRYGHLEWTDGELCIRLPRQNRDLILEGKVLDHCVGRYGKGHVAGDGVIFFVRKYRRPERSYFTLDIKMTGGAPYEVQLHGYKNEWVGSGHLKQRKIPRKVRSFVDRWKQEVLMPWYISTVQDNRKGKTA